MLYLTTRSDRDAYTAHRAITEEHGPDGGLYIPFTLPEYTPEEIAALKGKSFSQIVADVLNMFFSSRLSSWDVDFCIGRNPMRLAQVSRKVIVAELWHNPQGKYEYMLRSLASKICCEKDIPSNWLKIAVRIAVLFGVYGEMLKSGAIEIYKTFDVSVQLGDFSAPIAVVYARKLGIPVETVICNGIDNSAVWDFLHKGTFNPAGTEIALQEGLERLICDTLKYEETLRFVASCKERKSYSVAEEQLPVLNGGFFVSVAGESRSLTTINSIYRTNSYVIDPNTAICFGGIQDYRAKIGESKLTLLLSEETPLHFAGDIMGATGLKKEKLEETVNS